MTANDLDLLERYSREHSQDSFTALVTRYMNLVYSAALRQVRSPQLAEDVCQTVFSQLARKADKLKPNTILSAWLYQTTRNASIDIVRSEVRRKVREQIAIQMSAPNETSAAWTDIEPLLDEAMQSLEQTDRTAILLRFFEGKSLSEVGHAIGSNEDAAQKRIQRAVERLRKFFEKRKLKIGAAGLVAVLSANAVQSAPSGLAVLVATSALANFTSTTTTVTVTKAIVMTTTQKVIVAVAAAGVLGAGWYHASVVHTLRQQVSALQQEQEQQAALNHKAQQLEHERDLATNALALATEETAQKKGPNEVLKLRGQVGQLRMENAQLGSTNALSKATATPEARRVLREAQKAGMGLIYKGFTQQAKLTTQQGEKLNDLLADHIMRNVDNVTTGLREKSTPEQMNAVFASEETALQQQIGDLIGPDALAQYQDYTKNLLSTLSAQQFKNMLDGTNLEKDSKSEELRQLIQQEAQAAISRAGLPADYQPVPILNFANIAFEQQGEQSLKLLDDIFQRAAEGASSFLSAAEVAKLQEFRATAISNNRGSLSVNRAIMAPIAN
jgi:RNA polymerase sigma factor (sigma-70 family)